MAYATQTDMTDRFGSNAIMLLTDVAVPRTGAINAAMVTKAIADAEARINGYLGARYSLPLASVPAELVRITCDLAKYFLTRDPNQETVQRYNDAIAWLRDVSNGKVTLGLPTTGAAPSPSGGPSVTGGSRIFNSENLEDF